MEWLLYPAFSRVPMKLGILFIYFFEKFNRESLMKIDLRVKRNLLYLDYGIINKILKSLVVDSNIVFL